jgi:hypothetical protein
MKNGQEAETNYVWPAPWFLSNYFYGHLRLIDLEFHKQLRKPIAKSLYPLLETGWYASSGEPYTKSYNLTFPLHAFSLCSRDLPLDTP